MEDCDARKREMFMLRLSLVSDDTSLSDALDGFAVDVIPCEAPALTGAEVGTDVFVVDARRDERVGVVGEFARLGRLLIVIAPDDAPARRQRYRDAGADECVAAGSQHTELAARIREIARRRVISSRVSGDRGAHGEYRVGDLSISLTRHEVMRDEHPIDLTPTQFRLLSLLLRHMPDATPEHRLSAAIHDSNGRDARDLLHAHIQGLREKLGDDAGRPQLLLGEPGFGYRLLASA